MARVRRLVPVAACLLGAAVGVACTPTKAPSTPAATVLPSDAVSPSMPNEVPSVAPDIREPRRSFLTIPRLGLRDHPVIRYRGAPDDAEGTRLQNGGSLASPRGVMGGAASGEIGNYIVTGHRLSSTEPFRYLPSLPDGSRIRIRVGKVEHVYEVRRTRWTSFRSARSLAAQRAPVPGRPGVEATRPMITLSTCATIEDHAAGNYWADEFDNPEHRIDKIGVLVTSRPVTG